ncbi:MAG: hypothetical protein MRZ36_06345 [Eubacterium sp.]|nr:hypothetical protein [Eubacterium sp.]
MEKSMERIQKEEEFIQQIRSNMELSDPKVALKIYNKIVTENLLITEKGFEFLTELKKTIVDSGLISEDMLPALPVADKQPNGASGEAEDDKETKPGTEKKNKTSQISTGRAGYYKRLYEGQVLLNKKLKIALAAMIIILAGFTFINLKFEYSIFTYFTNYKAKMEEELIDKYENWESELEEREQQLEQKEGGQQNGQQ